MSGEPVCAFRLAGADATAALDWLHVHGELLGVLEADDHVVVWSAQALPELPFAGLDVRELAVDPAAAAITGLEHDQAILVADDLLVRPPWVESPAGFRGIELVVPRGAAFGSGEHASTQAALRVLHRVWNGSPSVADVGTGSGILLLYAAVRGCADLQGCDIDGPSVAAARELLPQARFALGGPARLAPAACVIANMTGAELTAAMGEILRLWDRRGPLVLSGMRVHEVEPVTALVGLPPCDELQLLDFTARAFVAPDAR
jgi:hypothetical protein